MAVLFFDSSALVKRYVVETGTAWVINQLHPSVANDIFIANITGIEKYGLRGYDTAQLAVGLSVRNRLAKSGVQNFTFISADNDLNSAAQIEGLAVDNPNNHP